MITLTHLEAALVLLIFSAMLIFEVIMAIAYYFLWKNQKRMEQSTHGIFVVDRHESSFIETERKSSERLLRQKGGYINYLQELLHRCGFHHYLTEMDWSEDNGELEQFNRKMDSRSGKSPKPDQP